MKNLEKSDSLQSLPNEMVEIHPMRVGETSGDLARKLKTLDGSVLPLERSVNIKGYPLVK